jgi:chromosome segregation ATPase
MAQPPPLPAPAVRLELRHGSARPVVYDVAGDEFVVGSVPGCDLRLAGANLPPVVCVIARHADGPRLRKLAPAVPLLLNGKPVQTATLRAGDAITLGSIALTVLMDTPAVSFVPIPPPIVQPHKPSTDLQAADLAERRRKLDEQAAELESDRVLWYRRRDELERECREREQALADLPQRQAEIGAKQQELDKLREELANVRRELFRQYQERRDRLAGLQQSVQVAARKVQEQKQHVDTTAQSTAQLREELAARLAEVEQREEDFATAQRHAEAEQKRRETITNDAAAAVEARLADCEKRERYLEDRDAHTRDEWGKVERLRADVEQRERDVAVRTADADVRERQLQRDLEQAAIIQARGTELTRLQEKLFADRQVIEAREIEVDRREAELRQQADELATKQCEVEALHTELTTSQKDLYQRYQERRDRLAGLQQAVSVAAKKVQESKRELTEQEQALAPRLADLDARRADLDRREQDLASARAELALNQQAAEAEQAGVAARLKALAEQLETRQAELNDREKQLAAHEERHRADLARLDRFQDTLDQRDRQLDAAEAELDRQRAQLQQDTLEMEEQARLLDAAQATHSGEDERLKQQQAELETATTRLTERAAQVEGQQAMLAALRTRLERMRGEVRNEAQLLAEQRVKQEAVERDLQEKAKAVEELQTQVEADREHFDGRSTELQTAVARLRELQDRLTAEEATFAERRAKLDAEAAEQAAQTAELKDRASQVLELQEKLTADRSALKEREAALARDEEARKALQEQLRRRAEDLAARQKQIDEQARDFEARAGLVGEEHEAIAAARANVDSQTTEVRQMADRLAAAQAELIRRTDRLKTTGRALAAGRKTHSAAKAQWQLDRINLAAEAEKVRSELADFRRQTAMEADTLKHQLPDLELRGQAVVTRLGQAREELRGHLAELHDFARQGQEDLEAVQARVRAEIERLREQEASVHKARAEHRLSVTAFRQQLIEWQGRVAEMRQVLADDGTRLERKQAEVSAAAKQVDETAQQLARQAADLQEQEREVVARRTEMERHLGDMREWYRRKLRELAESRTAARPESAATIVPMPTSGSQPVHEPANPDRQVGGDDAGTDILSLTEDLDPGDRQLGDLLRSLELVDADTLTTLLLEARRQRRSLRQVLLSSRNGGPLLTLYQLALIESGNLDALVLGPTRVIDRLQATQREAVYRVFDPRRAADGHGTLLLRHLAEAEMQDAVHPDEFRQRFAALAALSDPHLAATLEVLEVNGRPAVLQEWLNGLPATDWPAPLSPNVWHRLLARAAAGLNAAHQAGLVHGRLTARSVVLTADGVVKLTGCGEPPWLNGGPETATPADDLTALGELATGWATGPRKKGARPVKPLPEPLQTILSRLRSDAADRYSSAADLLTDLERVEAELPPAVDAWNNLLSFAAENATEGVAWRKSA